MDELISLVQQNNIMLRQILEILQKEQNEDFMSNVAANILADKLMGR